jgi:phosphate transport system protein
MWRTAADAYVERNPHAADMLRERDDEIDDLLVSLTAELASGVVTLPVAIEVALLGRFYERLGDHAVNLTERVRYLATGL